MARLATLGLHLLALTGSAHCVALPSWMERRSSEAAPTGAQFYNKKTAPYYIDPSKIPSVTFDSGESYAGLTPVNASAPAADLQQMFSWFYPTVNPAGKDDIVIWLNGGPGCSSLEGFLQENGPLSWKPGTYAPVPNAFSWNKLAHAIWVEYPIGTGFSTGPITATDNDDAAQQFLGFWENYLKTFTGLQGKKIYISGESYAGVHVPYIAAAMIARNDTTFFNVAGALYYDPVMPQVDAMGIDHAVTPALYRYWEHVFALPQKFSNLIEQDNKKCGLDKYLNTHLTYPPPAAPWPNVQITGCDVVADFDSIVAVINACYNPYHLLDTCPIQWDVEGYPNPVYTPEGTQIYWNQPAVQKLIGVTQENHTWAECQGPVFAGSGSDNYNGTEHEERLQSLLSHTNNVLIGQGRADNVIQSNLTALGIQYLSWNGKQGFQKAPSAYLTLPFVNNAGTTDSIPQWAGYGQQGTAHTERGLTYSEVYLSGHMVPQYTPDVAFRHLEFVLGRVQSLSSGQAWSVNISTSFTYPY